MGNNYDKIWSIERTLCLLEFTGRRMRILRSVATTKHRCQVSTGSVENNKRTRSIKARREGSARRTTNRP